MKKRTWQILFLSLIITIVLGSVTFIKGETTDSGLIAFESTRTGNSTDPVNDDIYIMNPDGSGVTRLTDSSDYDGVPCWSPDGSKIVFESWRKRSGMDFNWGNSYSGMASPQCLVYRYANIR